MKYIRVVDGFVVEIIPDYATPPAKWYGDGFASHCIQVDNDSVQCGWVIEPDNSVHPYNYLPDAIDAKLQEIATACQETIYDGADVTLSDGSVKHFSYTLADQSNVSEMVNALVMGATEYPYHADGETCQIYEADDILAIYVALATLKTSAITYHNQLKIYVESLKDAEAVEEVRFGQELTGEYLDNYNKLCSKANLQIQNIVKKILGN